MANYTKELAEFIGTLAQEKLEGNIIEAYQFNPCTGELVDAIQSRVTSVLVADTDIENQDNIILTEGHDMLPITNGALETLLANGIVSYLVENGHSILTIKSKLI